MERRTCERCGQVIPKGRIDALPATRTCVNCSRVKPYTEDDGMLDGADPDDLRQIAKTPEREMR